MNGTKKNITKKFSEDFKGAKKQIAFSHSTECENRTLTIFGYVLRKIKKGGDLSEEDFYSDFLLFDCFSYF